MDERVDRGTYLNYFLTELLYDCQAKYAGRRLRQLQVTDCKSLYDAVVMDNPSLTEKRTVIVVRSIQDHISERDLRWVPTHQMHADGLTKHSRNLQDDLRQWMKHPTVCLRSDGIEKQISPV